MNVPILELKPAYEELAPELDAAYHRVMASGHYLLGPELEAFEAEFAAATGTTQAVGVANGLEALQLVLMARGIGPGDEVIVPSNGYIATWLAVTHAGAKPVPCEPDLATYNLDPARLGALLTGRTKAILPIHLYGQAADLAGIRAVADPRGIFVLEDAAQAHGATFDGRPVGAIGRTGAFSLQSSKNLSAGEGGIFVTNDSALADKANRLRNFGQDVYYSERSAFDAVRPLDGGRSLESLSIGWMYRGNELMAAFARAQLARLADATARARANADRLAKALCALPGVAVAGGPAGASSVHHKFRVSLDPKAAGVGLSARALRDVTRKALHAEGVEVVLWQTASLPAQSTFQHRKGFGTGFPWSADPETDFAAIYAPERFPNTQHLLDSSVVLFSQSCPLIAQTAGMVDRYAEAFARVWRHRGDLEQWARREGIADAAAE